MAKPTVITVHSSRPCSECSGWYDQSALATTHTATTANAAVRTTVNGVYSRTMVPCPYTLTTKVNPAISRISTTFTGVVTVMPNRSATAKAASEAADQFSAR